MKQANKNIKSVLKSRYTLRILWKIYGGYRPSQISRFLRISEQSLHYHTNQLIEANLIEKFYENGLAWRLTSRGLFILKEMLSRTVNNSYHYNNLIPIRIHNVSFSFNIVSIDGDLRLRWIPINNGVLKCFIKYPNHTLEITKSLKKGESVLVVHLSEEYDNGNLVKKPHFAFEKDIIATYLATFQTAEITAKGGKAWIDSSKGFGEIESDNYDYAYKYLRMPENIIHIIDSINWLKRRLSGYAASYDPYLTNNN